jgi:hypothetical protein
VKNFFNSPIRVQDSRTFKGLETSANGRLGWSEFFIAAFALIALLAAEWILVLAIPGTNYSQGDGKMAQGVLLTASSPRSRLFFRRLWHTITSRPLRWYFERCVFDDERELVSAFAVAARIYVEVAAATLQ